MEYIVYYYADRNRYQDDVLVKEKQAQIINVMISETGEVVQSFSDMSKKRPELEKAIELCVSEGYTLIVAKTAFLSASGDDIVEIYNRLNGLLVCCDLSITNEITLGVIADNIKQTVIAQRLKPKKSNRGRPVGQGGNEEARERALRVRRENRDLYYAKHYETILEMYTKNYSLREIATHLNDNGITTMGSYTRDGSKFDPSTIKRLLNIALRLKINEFITNNYDEGEQDAEIKRVEEMTIGQIKTIYDDLIVNA